MGKVTSVRQEAWAKGRGGVKGARTKHLIR